MKTVNNLFSFLAFLHLIYFLIQSYKRAYILQEHQVYEANQYDSELYIFSLDLFFNRDLSCQYRLIEALAFPVLDEDNQCRDGEAF